MDEQNHAEFDHTRSERIAPCQNAAEPPTGATATTDDRTSTASVTESPTPATGGIESTTTAASGPSGRETPDRSRQATGASTAAPSRDSTPPEGHPCGHAERISGCGGCDPGAIEFVMTDDGERRPFDAQRDLSTPPEAAR